MFSQTNFTRKALLFQPSFGEGIVNPMLDCWIAKHEIFVKDAWEVGENDIEGTAIHEGDDPIIPKGITNPPILELFRAKRKQQPNKRKRSH